MKSLLSTLKTIWGCISLWPDSLGVNFINYSVLTVLSIQAIDRNIYLRKFKLFCFANISSNIRDNTLLFCVPVRKKTHCQLHYNTTLSGHLQFLFYATEGAPFRLIQTLQSCIPSLTSCGTQLPTLCKYFNKTQPSFNCFVRVFFP